jgi:integrase
VRITGLEPVCLAALPPQSSVNGRNGVHFDIGNKGFTHTNSANGSSVLTSVLTKCPKSGKRGRFKRIGNGLFRFKNTGVLYGVFKRSGRTHWKSLGTSDAVLARHLLAKEKADASKVDWHKAGEMTLARLIAIHQQNPMGLAATTFKIRTQLLNVFQRTWPHGLEIRANEIKSMMLRTWLAERRQQQKLKASGVNNYIRMLHGLFKIAVESKSVVESPAKTLELIKEESPERLTPTWEQCLKIINVVRSKESKIALSAMLLFGLGQAELANLSGENVDWTNNKITIRRQKTQRVFTIPIYPQAKPLMDQLKNEGRIVPNRPVFRIFNPREALALACKKLGFPSFSPRSFRRAFIIRALEKNIDPRCVAEWQGHQNAILVLKVYGSIINRTHNESMAMLLNN